MITSEVSSRFVKENELRMSCHAKSSCDSYTAVRGFFVWAFPQEGFLIIKSYLVFFEILTTSSDEDDKVYVSTVCSWNYPVTGFQWHPEKNVFEWGSLRIPHREDVIQVTQYAANYLVSEARKSKIRPVAQEALDNLIYNYSPIYVGKAGRVFDEVYIFT